MEETALQQAIAETKLEKEAKCIQCIRQAIAETNEKTIRSLMEFILGKKYIFFPI